MKKYHKDYNKESIVALNSLSRHLVFSYFKDEDDENKKKAIKKFIISSSCTVIDYPSGANNYTYVIKLLLGDIYNNREILLCFEDKGEQQNWLRSFNTSMQSSLPESDLHDLELEEQEVQKFEPVTDSPLQKELNRMRSQIEEEKKEKLRLSTTSSCSVDEEYEEFKKHEEDGVHGYVKGGQHKKFVQIFKFW